MSRPGKALRTAFRTLLPLLPTRAGAAPSGPPSRQALDAGLSGLQQGQARVSAQVYGTLRRLRSLEYLLGCVARRALKGRNPELRAALLLGAWGWLCSEPPPGWSDRVARLLKGNKDRQRVARVLTDLAGIITRHGEVQPEDIAAGRALPGVRRGAILAEPLLELGNRSLATRLGIVHSYPDALVASWLAAFGEPSTRAVCRAGNQPPPLFLRVHRGRSTAEALAAQLADEGIEAQQPEGAPEALRLLRGRGSFRGSPTFRQGLFSVQDLTSQQPARLLDPAPGERVLDLCAAPGGKASQMAEGGAQVVACDIHPGRLRKVTRGAERLGVQLDCQRLDGRDPAQLARLGRFPAVLVDAPCSNTGVLRRRPEARWRFSPKGQQRHVRDQTALLEASWSAVEAGGRLVYSVCSLQPDEGPGVLAGFLSRHADARLVRQLWFLPHPECGDGGFQARLDKAG